MFQLGSTLRRSVASIFLLAAACGQEVATAPERSSTPPGTGRRSLAGPVTVYGPATLIRANGRPNTFTQSFSADPGVVVSITISSDAPQGVSGSVVLNGDTLVSNVGDVALPLTITATSAGSNHLVVRQTGKPGSRITIVATIPPAIDPVTLIPGLVLYYPLDGNGNDASGSGINAAITNGDWVADRHGQPISAFHLSSNSGWGSASFGAGSPVSLSTSDQFTAAMWVRLDSLPQSDLAGLAFSIGINDFGAGFGQRAGGASFAQVCTPSEFCFTTEANAGVVSNVLPAGAWAHLALQYDGVAHTLTYYLNGQVAGSVAMTLSARTLDTGLWFGAAPFAPQYWTRGAMDDIRVYNRLLTSSEIARLAAN